MVDRASLQALLGHLTPSERAELDALVRAVLWVPLPGPQMQVYQSDADVIGYGGAAGGGKTDLALGLALTRHHTSAIFRREGPQLDGIIERLAEILGHRKGLNMSSPPTWRLADGRRITFGSCPNAGDEARHQGRAKDLLVLDEATGFLASQVRFLMGWVRSTRPGQKCRVLMTFNPPTHGDGRWVMDYFAPWLQPNHPDPAKPGELRWFLTIDGQERQVPPDTVIIEGGVTVRPQSRTFIPARVTDNPFLAGTSYMSTLSALPEPLRSQMLNGDFTAGMEDDEYQVIPSEWISAAMSRWTPRDRKGDMSALGVDVARGGRDQTVIARRHGPWFDALLTYPGQTTPDGPTVAAKVIAARRDFAPVIIDVIGWGASAHDFLRSNAVQVVAHNGAAGSRRVSREGGLAFFNKRAEAWWSLREALSPTNPDPIALPPDEALRADLMMPRWSLGARGIQIESKDEIIKRLGRSPDRGDAVCMALYAVLKTGVKTGVPVFGLSQKKET